MNPVIEQPTATPGAPPPAAAPGAPAPAAAPAAPVSTTKEPTLAEHEDANRRTRHRARSQQAGPDDVPRIQNLTAKNRALQAELDALKGTPSAPAAAAPAAAATAVATAKPAAAAPAVAPPARVAEPAGPGVIPVVAADKDPEPNPADYVDAPEKNYVKDQARWEARQEIREANARAADAHAATTIAAEKTRLATSWARREVGAKAKYGDFERVAYAPTRIPQGSMIDNYIIEAEPGLDVLYHLQKNPAELDSIMALSLFDPATGSYPQLEALTSLARRLAPGASPDGTTGASAPATAATRLPRPPTPVRTGPMNVAMDEPPGEDASIAEHEAYYSKKRR